MKCPSCAGTKTYTDGGVLGIKTVRCRDCGKILALDEGRTAQ